MESKSSKGNRDLTLPELQNRIKKEFVLYKDEFMRKLDEYDQRYSAFRFSTNDKDEELEELVLFIAHVIHCYPDPERVKHFVESVVTVLKEKGQSMQPETRMALVKSIILLKNKGIIQATSVIELFFGLFRCEDKLLRKTLRIFIIHDIKRANARTKCVKVNSSLQNFMTSMLQDSHKLIAKEAVHVLVDLYRRNIWKDAKTVNIIATACFSPVTKVVVPAFKFFLGQDATNADDSESESEPEVEKKEKAKQLKVGLRVGPHSKKRNKKFKRALAHVKRQKKKKNITTEVFSAIHLLHDPQGFAEKLFKNLEKTNERFEVRLMMVELVARVIGIHQLIVLNFYPFVQRYLVPHQKEVTHLLTFAAQATHDLIPPDVIEPVVRTIADNFITDRASSEAITVGLNAVREICTRCPYAISEDLLGDLVQYRTYRNKNVVAAARSIIRLFRQVNPTLLSRKERGRPTVSQAEADKVGAMDGPVREYGQDRALDFLPGAEVLNKEEKLEEDGWESCSDSEEDGDWIRLAQSNDEDDDVSDEQEVLTAEERAQKAAEIVSSRILTQEEFAQIRSHQLSKQMETARAGRKRKRESGGVEEEEESGEVVSHSAITHMTKRPRSNKQERMESVAEGRKDREKYGFKVNRQNVHASTTNREKKKKKPFQMIKHKAKKKDKRSFRDKQISLRDSLKKMAKFRN